MALMPLASITFPAVAAGLPAAAETIFPPRITMDPLSITVPLPTMMRAFLMVRSCAKRDENVPKVRQTKMQPNSLKLNRFIAFSQGSDVVKQNLPCFLCDPAMYKLLQRNAILSALPGLTLVLPSLFQFGEAGRDTTGSAGLSTFTSVPG